MESELTIVGWVIRVFAGLAVGLLINYFADVLPASRRLTKPVCHECQHRLSWKIYLLLQKCPQCGQRNRFRPIFVLVACSLVSILLTLFPFAGLNFWASLPILVFLGLIVVIDIEHRLVLHETSLAGLVLFLVYGIILRGILPTILGGLGGFGIMLAFYLTGVIFVKILGKLRNKNINEVAFGFGDVSAGTFLGLLAGWPGIVGVVIVALLSFGIYALGLLIVLVITKKYRAFSNPLPFAPFLVLGVVVLYYL